MRLVQAYPHRWGEGKIHIALLQSGPRSDSTLCRVNGVHGDVELEGAISIVTCRKCRAAYYAER